jgi:hypothetical protein
MMFHSIIPFHEIQDNFVLKDSLFYFVFDDTSNNPIRTKDNGTDGATENDCLGAFPTSRLDSILFFPIE